MEVFAGYLRSQSVRGSGYYSAFAVDTASDWTQFYMLGTSAELGSSHCSAVAVFRVRLE